MEGEAGEQEMTSIWLAIAGLMRHGCKHGSHAQTQE